ncbi:MULTISPECIES: glycosyltransferase [unclassified Coleofasciculus]|uniref:glycosyltransferase n=1 Tax=unclassified Coleofasciculus TaxID=2692782 RepID=UPI00187F4FEF|nr:MULTISPECIES: glycosyltransferase [unclassified Coleofasciculus]MBE9125146.1 tetratricopeptide repeat protein [Coleofasciculus sp. LEGE 07081]MBE9148363.1 tetratricopeptide repeat protein [Coleofasciculus sp. LEGE 07092]
MDLSLCTIVKNEENNTPQLLESVKSLVDEIVILDTGSIDRTVEVAKAYGAKIYQFEWCNDFAAARNYALQYVQGKWVLVLDADEVLTPEILPEIQQAIKSDRYLVVNLLRQEVGASQSPYSLVSRLFRNHPDIRFSRPYHAMVDDSVSQLLQQEPHWQVISLPTVAILHYGYQPEAIAAQDKYTRAKAAMEGFLVNHPNDAYTCSKLGALYIQIDKVNEGIALLKRGLTDSQIDAPVLFELHYHLGNAYTRQNDIQLAAQHYQDAIGQPIFPQLKVGAYNNLGNLLLRVGDLTTARTAFETTLKIAPNFAAGYNNLGMTLKALGQLGEAIAAYQNAIQLNRDYADAYQNLGVALLKIGKVPESLSAFGKAIALHEKHSPSEAQRLRLGLQEIGFQI